MSIPSGMQNTGLTRNTIDKYYTKPSVVHLCISAIARHIHVGVNDLIIEPSAGNGAFIRGIQTLTPNYIFYDLEPEHANIIQQDYLRLQHVEFVWSYKNIHIVGNPPFGRQSSLAIKFIKKSCEFCNTVSFILPKSFKKDSLKKTFPSKFHLICEFDLPDNSFAVNGIDHNVPCVFQIWERKTYDRPVSEKLEPHNFVFVDKTENPDISFRRVGVNAGTIDTNIDEKSTQSHYFIKFTNGKPLTENLNALATITYDFNNTVGPKSISKQELIKEVNKVI